MSTAELYPTPRAEAFPLPLRMVGEGHSRRAAVDGGVTARSRGGGSPVPRTARSTAEPHEGTNQLACGSRCRGCLPCDGHRLADARERGAEGLREEKWTSRAGQFPFKTHAANKSWAADGLALNGQPESRYLPCTSSRGFCRLCRFWRYEMLLAN